MLLCDYQCMMSEKWLSNFCFLVTILLSGYFLVATRTLHVNQSVALYRFFYILAMKSWNFHCIMMLENQKGKKTKGKLVLQVGICDHE